MANKESISSQYSIVLARIDFLIRDIPKIDTLDLKVQKNLSTQLILLRKSVTDLGENIRTADNEIRIIIRDWLLIEKVDSK
ncbi:hypothetical protein J4214_03760 [Candidatus Woesearchaeota archaeon]|nr:hypothetical protein [Candidatus Woesearchaeota archaeon]